MHPRCEAILIPNNYRIEDQIIRFLTDLNEQFLVVKTQVFLMDYHPSMNKVYCLVVQDERNNAYLPLLTPVDCPKILFDAFKSRRQLGLGNGFCGNTKHKNGPRHCTHFNKTNVSMNAYSCEVSETPEFHGNT